MTPAVAALCPSHPDAPSVATCRRCGRFLCAACVALAEPPLCATCAPTFTDPLGIVGAPFSFWNTLQNGARMLVPVLQPVLVLTLLFSIPGGLVSFAVTPGDDPTLAQTLRNVRVSNLYDALIGVICTTACIALFIGVAEGQRLNLRQALQEAVSRWGRVFGARFRSGLLTLLFLLLLVLPGIWKGVLLVFATEAAVRVSREDALEVSSRLVRERWWPVFGTIVGIYVIVYLPMMIGVGIFDVAAGLTPAPRPVVEIFEDWFIRFADMFATACVLSAFYGLSQSTGNHLEPMRWRSSVSENSPTPS